MLDFLLRYPTLLCKNLAFQSVKAREFHVFDFVTFYAAQLVFDRAYLSLSLIVLYRKSSVRNIPHICIVGLSRSQVSNVCLMLLALMFVCVCVFLNYNFNLADGI